jgi:hypothetical protein
MLLNDLKLNADSRDKKAQSTFSYLHSHNNNPNWVHEQYIDTPASKGRGKLTSAFSSAQG